MPLFFGPLRNIVNFMLAIPSLQNKQFLEVPIRLWLSKCTNRGYHVSALCFGKKSDTEGTVTDEDTACSSDSDGKVGSKQRSIVAKSVQLCTAKKIQSETSKQQSAYTKSSANDESCAGDEAEKPERSIGEDSAAAASDAKSTSVESSRAASAPAKTPKPIENKSTPRTSSAASKPPVNPSTIATQPSVLEAKSAQQQNPKKRESKISKFFRRRSSRSKSRNRKVSKSPAEPSQQTPTQQKAATTPTECDGSSEAIENAECSNMAGAYSDTEASTEMENESVCETMANMSAPCKPMPDIVIPKRPIVTVPESESDCEPPLSNVEMRQKADESESDCETPIESSGIYPKENESICGTWEPQKPLKQASEMHESEPPPSNVSHTSAPDVPPTSHSETVKPTTPTQQKPAKQKMPKGKTPNTQPQPAAQVQPKPAPVGRKAPPPPNRQQIPKKEAKRRKFWQKRSPTSKTPHIHYSDPPSSQKTQKPAKQTSQKAGSRQHRSIVHDNTPLGPNAMQQRPLKKQVSKQRKRSSGPHEPKQKSSSVRQETPKRYDPASHKQGRASAGSNRETSMQRKSSNSRHLPDYSKCSQKESSYSQAGSSHPGQQKHASQAPRTDPKVKDRKRSSSRKKSKSSYTSLGPYPPDPKQHSVRPGSPKEGPLRQHTSTERTKQTTHQSRAPQREDRSKKLAQPVAQKSSQKRPKLWDRLRSKSPTKKPPASTHGQHQNQPKQHQPSKHGHSHKHSSMGSPSTSPKSNSTENKRCNGSPPRLKQCVPNKPKHTSFSHAESDCATDSDHQTACGSMMKTRLNRSEAVCRSLVEKTPRKAFDFGPSESESECEAAFKQRGHETASDLESCERDQSQSIQKRSAPSDPSQKPQTPTHSQASKQPQPQSTSSKPPTQKTMAPPKDTDVSKKRSRLWRRRSTGSKTRKQKAAPSQGKPQVAAQRPMNQPQGTASHAQLPMQASAKSKPAPQKKQSLPAKVESMTKQPKVSVPSRDTAKLCFGPPKMRSKEKCSSLEHTDTESGTESEHPMMQEPCIGDPRHRMSESESECELSMQADTKVRSVESDSDCDLSAHITSPINETKQQPKPIPQAPKQQHKQIQPGSSTHQPKKIQPHKETPKQRDALEVSSEPFSAKTPSQNTKPEGKGYPDKGLKFWKKISYRSKILKKRRSSKKRSETKKAESGQKHVIKSKSSKPAKPATSQTKTQMQTKSAPASRSPSKTRTMTDTKPASSSTESNQKDKSKICFGPPKMRSKSESEYSKKSTTCSDTESGTDSGTECEQHQPESSKSDAPCTKSEFAGICAEAYKTDSDVETCPKDCSDGSGANQIKQSDFVGVCDEANKKHPNSNQKKDESDSDCDRNKK